MIFNSPKIERCRYGRHTISRSADFLDINNIPNWLTLNAGVTKNGNAAGGITSAQTMSFTCAGIECCELKIYNMRFLSETPNASISLVNSNGTKSISLLTDTTNSVDKVVVTGSNDDFTDTEVDFGIYGDSTTARAWGLVSYDAAAKIGTKPKNIGIIVSPTYKFFAILDNGYPVYEHSINMDFSGEWHFEITSNSAITTTGVQLEIETNYL